MSQGPTIEQLRAAEGAVLKRMLQRASQSDAAANAVMRHLSRLVEREVKARMAAPPEPTNREIVAWSRAEPGRGVASVVDHFYPQLRGPEEAQARRRAQERIRRLLTRDRKANGPVPAPPPVIHEIDARECSGQDWARWSLRMITRAMTEARPQDLGGLAKAGLALFGALQIEDEIEITEFSPEALADDLRELGPMLELLQGGG